MYSLIIPGLIAFVFLTLITLLSLYSDTRALRYNLLTVRTPGISITAHRLIARRKIDHLLAQIIITKSLSYAKQI